MKERLDILGFQRTEDWSDFIAQTGSVIATGIKSAVKTLQILTSEYSVLGKVEPRTATLKMMGLGSLTHHLDAFLPYDVEFTFGAALNLTMVKTVFPDVVDYHTCHEMAHQTLDDLVCRGNRVACARRAELFHLEDICHELILRDQQQELPALQLLGIEPHVVNAGREQSGDHEPTFSAEDELHFLAHGSGASQTIDIVSHVQPTSDMELLDYVGISSEEFHSIVQQIGSSDTFPDSMLTLD